MNTQHYMKMAEDILKDYQYYEKLSNDPMKKDRIQYQRLLHKHRSCLRENEYKYLSAFEIKHSQFYGLHKVYKSEEIRQYCELSRQPTVYIGEIDDSKLRPIIAGPACLTNRLSNLIDILLKPLVKHVPSFLRDTTNFLKQIPTTVPDDTLLVSFDVESLYSNICNALGIEAVTYWIDQFHNEIPQRFSKGLLSSHWPSYLKIILSNSITISLVK